MKMRYFKVDLIVSGIKSRFRCEIQYGRQAAFFSFGLIDVCIN